MCGRMVDIQSPTAEIRRGKKERRNHRMKIYMACPIIYGGHEKYFVNSALQSAALYSADSRRDGGSSEPKEPPGSATVVNSHWTTSPTARFTMFRPRSTTNVQALPFCCRCFLSARRKLTNIPLFGAPITAKMHE